MQPGTETANRERLGDFYLYPIAERTTIANAQTKQVSFLDIQGVPARRRYAREVGWLASDQAPVNVSSQVAFSSSREEGLGDALPAGTVRFYQRDAQGTPQFVGESGIGHTPMGSLLTLRTGDAFDVLVQAEVASREKITAAEYERRPATASSNGEVVRTVEVDARSITTAQRSLQLHQRQADAGRGRAGPGGPRPRLLEPRPARHQRGCGRPPDQRRPARMDGQRAR